MIVLFIPVLSSLNLPSPLLLALIVPMAVSNSMLSFLPSIIFGVPDSGNELSILPGHRMLLSGYGYQAIKLTIVGGIGAVLFCAISFPLIVFAIPFLFDALSGYIYLLLIGIASVMVLTEEDNKKLTALALFLAAGSIGIMSSRLPLDGALVLFPIFSGFFGVSLMLLQVRNNVQVPKQSTRETFVSKGLINRSVLSGSVAGVFSGLLPGVGASEVASLASIGKNEKAFLVRIGALTMANIILSILALWLIGRSRSGIAVVIEQLASIGAEEALLIMSITLVSGGLASVCALILARKGMGLVNSDYRRLVFGVMLFILGLTYLFTGFYGIMLLVTCGALGITANLVGIKRGIFMGVLILPTIIFYLS